MSYRAREIAWHPRVQTEWATFTASRREAARLWGDLVVRHHRVRRLGWHWPSKARWQRWAKGRYPGLTAQRAQQIIGECCEAVGSCRPLRQHGVPAERARYPWRLPCYHDVVYTHQDARIRDGRLLLPHGTSGRLRLPDTITLPGRLMEVRLSYGVVRLICENADAPRPQQTVIGVDLGVNTLAAATDGQRVILISGRGAKATVQYRNKQLASRVQRQARGVKHSRRSMQRQRRK